MEKNLMTDCPLKEDFHHAAFLGKELARAMRRIRSKMKICDECDRLEDCGIRREFNSIVDAVIVEIRDEWDLIAARSSEARASQ